MPGASSTPLATSTPKGRTPLTNSWVVEMNRNLLEDKDYNLIYPPEN